MDTSPNDDVLSHRHQDDDVFVHLRTDERIAHGYCVE